MSYISRLTCALFVITVAGGTRPAVAQSTGSSGSQFLSWPQASPCRTAAGSSASQYQRRPVLSPFKDAALDFRRLPSRDTMTFLAAGGALALAAHAEDAPFSRTLSGSRSLHETVKAGALIGGTPFELGAAIATYGIGRALKNPCAASLGADLIQAQLMAEAMTMGVKFAVRRQRPDGTGLSFPSGHTAVTFASATVLQRHFGWKVGIPAYAVASYVATSRVQTKRHFASDVAFGAALGIVAGRTVTMGRAGRWALSPMASPDGGGATFTWVGKK